MIRVFVPSTVAPRDLDRALDLYGRLVAATVHEPGCMSYELLQRLDDPCELILAEEWESQEHLDAHTRTPHFLELVPQLAEIERAAPALRYRKLL